MGIGDQLIATGIAKGTAASGKRMAFGDGRRIYWDMQSAEIFGRNPNIAPPGSEKDKNIVWHPYRKGNRIYNQIARDRSRWIWNETFNPRPGEMFFSDTERANGKRFGKGFILIEPNVNSKKMGVINKDWGFNKYKTVALTLLSEGYRVAQFAYPGSKQLPGVEQFHCKTFRGALSVLANAALYIGAEGGMHHGAAAVNVGGVVLFGGWIPPGATGYSIHTNIASGEKACGLLRPCSHCKDAMNRITITTVFDAVIKHLRGLQLA